MQVGEIDPKELAVIERLLPELMVMARARHADWLRQTGSDISYCGYATRWEECCTVTILEEVNGPVGMLRCLLWFNLDKETKAVSIIDRTT